MNIIVQLYIVIRLKTTVSLDEIVAVKIIFPASYIKMFVSSTSKNYYMDTKFAKKSLLNFFFLC